WRRCGRLCVPFSLLSCVNVFGRCGGRNPELTPKRGTCRERYLARVSGPRPHLEVSANAHVAPTARPSPHGRDERSGELPSRGDGPAAPGARRLRVVDPRMLGSVLLDPFVWGSVVAVRRAALAVGERGSRPRRGNGDRHERLDARTR